MPGVTSILIGYQWFPESAKQNQPILWRRATLIPLADGQHYTVEVVDGNGAKHALSMVPYPAGGKFEYQTPGAAGPYEQCYIDGSDLIFQPGVDGQDCVVPFRARL